MEKEIEQYFFKVEDVEELLKKSINELKIIDLNKLNSIKRIIYVGNKNSCSYSCNYLQEDDDNFYCIENNKRIRLRENSIEDEFPCERSVMCKSIYGV